MSFHLTASLSQDGPESRADANRRRSEKCPHHPSLSEHTVLILPRNTENEHKRKQTRLYTLCLSWWTVIICPNSQLKPVVPITKNHKVV